MDYRIMAFVLATGLQLVIDSIINQDQTAYFKNRYMGYNIRPIDDVIDYFDRFQKKLFMADFEKAFGSLDWGFMFKTLDFFKFGPSFKRPIRTLYTLPGGRILKIIAIFQMSFQYQGVYVRGAPSRLCYLF